jgi:hypothetical protein
MATLLKADGSTRNITERLTLATMQRVVGGYIELVTIGGTPDRRDMLVVDEEGLLKQKPINQAATALYRGTPARHNGVIVGDAIRCTCTHIGTERETYE